jgi:hypothetical protein
VATLFGSKSEGTRKVGKLRMSSLEDAKKKKNDFQQFKMLRQNQKKKLKRMDICFKTGKGSQRTVESWST